MTTIRATLARPIVIDGPDDLSRALDHLIEVEAPCMPRTLDLIAHSTARGMLHFGTWVLDASDPSVAAFWRGLVTNGVLAQLGIEAVRLLGCLTADSDEAAANVCTLADNLGIEVYGALDLLACSYYERDGFAHERRYLLMSSRELRAQLMRSA